MRVLLRNFVLFALLQRGLTVPVVQVQDDPELTGGFFEGDIEVDLDRNGFITETRRWPNGIVHYRIDDVFDKAHSDYIITAMKIIELQSCIRFLPAEADTVDVLHVIGEPTGCHTKVGYRGDVQTVNLQIYDLDTGCFRMGTIEHELLHALGFYHQQSAPERDEYVKIVEENIIEGKEHNFVKYADDVLTDFGIEYDYGSVLHYSSLAFSKNGEKTIVPLIDVEIGQRLAWSQSDINKLNIMYKCPIQV